MPEEQMQVVPIPLSIDPNTYYVTNINLMASEEDIVIQMHTGSQLRMFVLSPKHAKRLAAVMQRFVADYEKKFEQVKTEIPKEGAQTSPNRIGFDDTKAI